jgi:hypothetical protein
VREVPRLGEGERVKPSEALQEIAKARGAYCNWGRYEVTVEDVIAFLDERTEVEQRRVALWTAMAMIGPGTTPAHIAPHLEVADIDYRPTFGEAFEDVRGNLLSAGRRAGLIP